MEVEVSLSSAEGSGVKDRRIPAQSQRPGPGEMHSRILS